MFWCAIAWIPLSLMLIGFSPWREPGAVYIQTFFGFWIWMALCSAVRRAFRKR